MSQFDSLWAKLLKPRPGDFRERLWRVDRHLKCRSLPPLGGPRIDDRPSGGPGGGARVPNGCQNVSKRKVAPESYHMSAHDKLPTLLPPKTNRGSLCCPAVCFQVEAFAGTSARSTSN